MEAPGQTTAWTELANMEGAITDRLTSQGLFQWAGYAAGKRDAYLASVALLRRVDSPVQALGDLDLLRKELKGRAGWGTAAKGYQEGAATALAYVRNRLLALAELWPYMERVGRTAEPAEP